MSAVWFPERGWGQQDGKCEQRWWFLRNTRWWLTLDRPLVSVIVVRRRLSASLSLPPPPSSANCTNMIRACETALSQIFPFPSLPFPTHSHLSETFPMWVLGFTAALFASETLRSLFQSYLPAPQTTAPQVSLPEDELAAPHHDWVGKSDSGQSLRSSLL